MFERFTDRARRVIVLAQDAARSMGHPKIEPEHLLVGLQQEGEGKAAKAMTDAGVDGAALRQRVAALHESAPAAKEVDRVPFSGEAKRCLEQALRAALALGHNYIGTEHLFLGVQRQSVASDRPIEAVLGVDVAEVQRRLTDLVGGDGHLGHSPALRSALGRARTEAAGSPMTTGHVLGSMLDDPDSQASRALSRLGVGEQQVRAALEAVDLAETTDASPAPASVAVVIGGCTTVIADADVATALQQLSAEQLREALRRAIGPPEGGHEAS
jgi:ATP-dependent Clp protease ATP-binding subunit ClpA